MKLTSIPAIAFAMLALPFALNAQSFEHDRTIIASPNAVAAASAGGVNNYTGKATISVPLHTVQSSKLSVPIGLSYDASGIQIEANASWVGQNWNLMAGGSVSRTVKGIPDDDFYGFINKGFEVDNHTSPYTGAADYLDQLSDGAIDGAPDIFRFNVNGASGLFFFDTQGQIVVESLSPMEVTYQTNNDDEIISFQIRTSNGVVYDFNEVERVKPSVHSGTVDHLAYVNGFPATYSSFSSVAFQPEYNAAWYLTRITSMNGDDQIDFQYKTYHTSYIGGYRQRRHPNGNLDIYADVVEIQAAKQLEKITWDHGEVTFIADHLRNDLPNSQGAMSHALTKVIVRDADQNFVSGHQLAYGNFNETGGTTLGGTYEYMNHRLQLQSVQRIGDENATSTLPATVFTYDPTPLPPKYSPQCDYWGYYNANGSNDLLPQQYFYPDEDATLAPYFSQFSFTQRSTYVGTEVVVPGADRSSNATAMQAGILTRINFPTGGYKEFEYESDQFAFDGQTIAGGGCRVKTITTAESASATNAIQTHFAYTDNQGSSTGKAMVMPVFASRESNLPSTTNHLTSVRQFSYSQLAPTRTQGSTVGYSEVSVSQTGQGRTVFYYNLPASAADQTADCDGNGNCVYARPIPEALHSSATIGTNYNGIWDEAPFAERPNYDWNRGLPIKSEVYNEAGQLLVRTQNTYTIKDYQKVDALKSRITYTVVNSQTGQPTTLAWKVARYYYLGGWVALATQKSELFDPADPVNSIYENTTTYTYDNPVHQNLTEVRSTDSEGKDLIARVRYPHDFTGFGASVPAEGLTLLRDHFKNYNVPIETTVWQDDGSGEKLISASLTTFRNFGTSVDPKVYPHLSYTLDTEQPATGFQPADLNGGTFNYDSRYRFVGKQLSYNDLGLPTAWQIDGAPVQSVLYGHRSSVPIASATNANPDEIAYTGFESDDQNEWQLQAANSNTTQAPFMGAQSRQVVAGAPSDGPTISLVPTDQDGRYLFSAWIKTPPNFGAGNAQLVLHTTDASSTTPYPTGVASAYVVADLGSTDDAWTYVEAVIDLYAIRQDAGLSSSIPLHLNAFVRNADQSLALEVDELRLHPEDALMQTMSYKEGFGVIGASAANGTTSHVEYDQFGRNDIVLNHLRQVLQKTNYNFGN